MYAMKQLREIPPFEGVINGIFSVCRISNYALYNRGQGGGKVGKNAIVRSKTRRNAITGAASEKRSKYVIKTTSEELNVYC